MKKLILLTLILLSLSSCGGLIPQKMDARIYIDKNSQYDINLKGTFIEYAIIAQEAANNELTEQDRKSIFQQETSMLKDPRFKIKNKVSYGKYDLEYSESGRLTPEVKLFEGAGFSPGSIIQINFVEKNRVEIYRENPPNSIVDYIAEKEKDESFKAEFAKASIEEKEKYQSDKIKLTSDFEKEKEFLYKNLDLKFRIKTNAKVIKHNAQKSPWFFGLFGDYEWDVKTPSDPAPYILLELNN